mmetsp:Transcript_27903/g.44725  ORF Transcript_27903/g.44725 Transcript_27903/m.44725 type:complete len:1066 (+) Transcript_27903:497-3694(+)
MAGKRKPGKGIADGNTGRQVGARIVPRWLFFVGLIVALVAIGLKKKNPVKRDFDWSVIAEKHKTVLSSVPFESEKLNRILEEIDHDPRHREVKYTLHEVDVESPNGPIHEWTTFTFADAINKTKNQVAFVIFFDPRSDSYILNKPVFEKAAKALSSDPELKSRASIGMINCAIDSFLQHNYAKEMMLTWQEAVDSTNPGGFRFGRPNFYPLVMKLYREGKYVAEFSEAISVRGVLDFLRRHLYEIYATPVDGVELTQFLEKRQPALIACLPRLTGEYKDEPTCKFYREYFFNATRDRHGYLYYALVETPQVCLEILHTDSCSLTVINSAKATTTFQETLNTEEELTKQHLNESLNKFISHHREFVISEVTPDNSWSILAEFPSIVILFVDLTEHETRARALEILDKAAQDPTLQEKEPVKFCFANGKNFGGQFNLRMEQMPNLMLYSIKEGSERELIFHDGSPDGDPKMLLDTDVDRARKRVVAWLLRYLDDKEDSAENEDVADSVDDEDIDDSVDDEDIDDSVDDEDVDHSVDDEDIADGVDDEDVSDSGLSEAASTTDNERNHQENIADQSDVAVASWKEELGGNAVEYSDEHVARTFQVAWEHWRETYNSILVMRESYESFGSERKARPENKFLKVKLKELDQYLNSKKYLAPLVGRIPETPARLEALLSNAKSKEEYSITIQKVDAFKARVQEWLEEDAKNEQEKQAVARMMVDEANFLYQFIAGIMRGRSDISKESFVHNFNREPTVEDQQVIGIERRSATEMTVEEFVNEYAKKRVPVIITDLEMFTTKWTKEHISRKCGHYSPRYVQREVGTHDWGGLTNVNEVVNLTTFLETHTTNTSRKKWYLHDWSLPTNCPEIMGSPPYEEFIYPKYFAGDYFQRLPFVGYQHSWPSLFVGANGTESKMHIDSGGTNFWMYLIEGVKEWRFFDRFDGVELYEEPNSPHFYVDVFRRNMTDTPLLKDAPMYQGFQKPGELIFIPGGCPHGVRNLDDIVGISMNYLDSSNEWLYLWTQLSQEDFRDYELYIHPSFPRGLKKTQKDLTLGEFKSQNWYSEKETLDLF